MDDMDVSLGGRLGGGRSGWREGGGKRDDSRSFQRIVGGGGTQTSNCFWSLLRIGISCNPDFHNPLLGCNSCVGLSFKCYDIL